MKSPTENVFNTFRDLYILACDRAPEAGIEAYKEVMKKLNDYLPDFDPEASEPFLVMTEWLASSPSILINFSPRQLVVALCLLELGFTRFNEIAEEIVKKGQKAYEQN